jgi:hypothetical protein
MAASTKSRRKAAFPLARRLSQILTASITPVGEHPGRVFKSTVSIS